MRAPLLAVASLTIDIAIGSVASDDRVQGLFAVLTLEAFAMPRSSFGEDLFRGEDDAAATRTALTWGSLDAGGVDHRGPGRLLAKRPRLAQSRRRAHALQAKRGLVSRELGVTEVCTLSLRQPVPLPFVIQSIAR
mgnify:FL=1